MQQQQIQNPARTLYTFLVITSQTLKIAFAFFKKRSTDSNSSSKSILLLKFSSPYNKEKGHFDYSVVFSEFTQVNKLWFYKYYVLSIMNVTYIYIYIYTSKSLRTHSSTNSHEVLSSSVSSRPRGLVTSRNQTTADHNNPSPLKQNL